MKSDRKLSNACEKARCIIHESGGLIKTSDALKAGIHPRTLYQLRDLGVIEQLSRGVYRLADFDTAANPDYVIVAKRVKNGVICLISALSFHEITTQIPHEVSVAIPKDSRAHVIGYPPIRFHKFSPASYHAGIEMHRLDGVTVKVYNPEKTLADCLKFRNKIGIDLFLEALKLYKSRKTFDHKKILEYARVCRVHKIMVPYLEAQL